MKKTYRKKTEKEIKTLFKRKLNIAVIVAMVFTLVLSGCAGTGTSDSENQGEAASQTVADLSVYENGDMFITPQELNEKLGDPNVIIFDESTSALDVHTETKLFSDLEKFLENKTVITIAHRLSTVKNASYVYVLEDGKLVQQGTHKELEQKEGHYLEFVKQQLI